MQVVCEQCQSKFKIPDEKIPKGKVFSLSCPKCNNKISVDTRLAAALSSEKTPVESVKSKSVQESFQRIEQLRCF